MINYKILEHYNCDEKMLRAVFTAEAGGALGPDGKLCFERMLEQRDESQPSDDVATPAKGSKEYKALQKQFAEQLLKTRTAFENRIESRLREGWGFTRKNHRLYFAADLAWDDKIAPERIPLMLYAQGKLDLTTDSTTRELVELERKTGRQFIERDPNDSHKIKALNVARLYEVGINLVRPYVMRRQAAQVNKYRTLFPWLKYEPRDTTQVGKLKAAALSQRVDILAEQYGWRSNMSQVLRDMLLYTHSISFRNCSWEKIESLRLAENGGDYDVETVIEREGFGLVNPHPSRVFWDRAFPLSSINTDTGISYIGWWDVVRASTVMDRTDFFNRSEIGYGESISDFWNGLDQYRQYYYGADVIKFPDCSDRRVFANNDAKENVGRYTTNMRDDAVVLTHYYEKIIPREVGIGTYAYPVWLHCIVANEKTVVFAEFEATSPAAVCAFNENDGKVQSMSMAHEIMPYQDQVQQMLDQMVYLMKLQSLVIIALNEDVCGPEVKNDLKKWIEGSAYLQKPLVTPFSFKNAKEILGSGGQARIDFLETTVVQLQMQINVLLSGITNITALLEKNLMLSPQEIGQFVTKEAVATEVNEVAKTTTALQDFTSEGPDNYRACLKRMAYESLVAHSSTEITLPIVEQFPDEVIEQAGFQPKKDTGVPGRVNPATHNIIGDPKAMVYSYAYDNRDGSQRPINPELAKVLSQLMAQFLGSEKLLTLMDNDDIRDSLTEVFRMSGSGFVPKLNGQGNLITEIQKIEQIIQKMAQKDQQHDAAIQQILGLLRQAQQVAGSPGQQGEPQSQQNLPANNAPQASGPEVSPEEAALAPTGAVA